MRRAEVPLARAGHDRRRRSREPSGWSSWPGWSRIPTTAGSPRTIVNRIWQRLMGRGIVHPVDVMANEPWSEDLLDYLATYLVDHGYDLKELIEHIVTLAGLPVEPGGRRPRETPADGYVFRGPEVKRMTAEQFLDAVWMITGTAPAKADAPVRCRRARRPPPEHRFVRAALVKSDALMRSLGRPNREQVVTTRGDSLTHPARPSTCPTARSSPTRSPAARPTC